MLALSQFVMTWVLGAWYLRKADREFDPLAERAAQVALEAGIEPGRRRFERPVEDQPEVVGDEGEVTRR